MADIDLYALVCVVFVGIGLLSGSQTVAQRIFKKMRCAFWEKISVLFGTGTLWVGKIVD
ncbi:MAG: hypothetical protein MSH41_04940 [Bacteroidales bacterium]|nr:hypothetical protein [Bacteroidales bacterium]